MANFNDERCLECPYKNQAHLSGTRYYNSLNVPLGIERGIKSNTLIVLQAPGEEEWSIGRPLQPVKKTGGTAGRRIELSWERMKKTRTNFDITNSVQCFPGKKPNGRDLEPCDASIICCFQWLKEDIKSGNYTKIIGFGDIAINQINRAISELNLKGKVQVVECAHPNSGLESSVLDSKW